MVPYLVLADMQNNVMAAIFTFADRVIYPPYATAAGNAGGSALEDQAMAGLIMWVPGSLLFLVPVVWLVTTALTPPTQSSQRAITRARRYGRVSEGWGRDRPRGVRLTPARPICSG